MGTSGGAYGNMVESGMKIGITSDIHLRHSTVRQVAAVAEEMAAGGAEVAVVAGDIGEGPAAFRRCLAVIRSRFPGDVLVLAGNHDLWVAPGYRAGASSLELWDSVLPAAVRETGCTDLERSVWSLGGVAIAGSIGWYDYSATEDRPPCPPAYYELNKHWHCKDADYITWPFSDIRFAKMVGDALADRLRLLERDKGVHSVLVATHMPVFRQQMRLEDGNAYYGNLTLGDRIAKFRKVKWVVSGHTHIGSYRTVLRDGPDILAAVVPSDYGKPGFVVVDTERQQMYSSDAQ